MYMYDQYYSQRLNRLGMGPDPGRSQLNSKNDTFLVPVRSYEFGLARRVQLYRPASAHSFDTLGINLVLTHEISPAFRDGVHLVIPPAAVGLVPS